METWRSIADFEALYEVSDRGRVRRKGKKEFLSPYMRSGYPAVSLKDGKRRKSKAVHSLVLETFVGPRPPAMQGAHLDGVKRNNNLSNLSWATPEMNEGHKRLHGTAKVGEKSHHARLTDEQAQIVRELVDFGFPQTKIAILAGVSDTAISRLKLGTTYA